MAETNGGYWSRSYALLTQQQGWVKPVLALAAARMVPVVGWFGADGYGLEWGRLTAWGVDSAPKQKGVDIGACIGSGARAFVVALGYTFVFGVIGNILSAILGGLLGGILTLVIGALSGIIIVTAKLRATIYQSIGAGYQVDRMADMIKRDSNGFLSVVGLSLVMNMIIGVVVGILVSIVMLIGALPFVHQIVELENAGYVSDERMAGLVFTMIAQMLPSLFVMGFVVCIVASFKSLIEVTATGLWMRQFDVQNWGNSSDPLPSSVPGAGTAYAQPAAEPTQWQAPQAAEPTQQPQSWEVPQPTEQQSWDIPQPSAAPEEQSASPVPTWNAAQEQPLQPVSEVPRMGEVPSADAAAPADAAPSAGFAVPTFTLDDAAPAPEPVAEVPTFTLDDMVPASSQDDEVVVSAFSLSDTPAVEPAAEPTFEVPTFTLDDEPAPAAPEPEVMHFTLDDPAPAAPEPEVMHFTLDDPAPAEPEPDPAIPRFTLDDAAPVTPYVEPTPKPLDDAPAPEPFEGPIVNDEDARAAMASLEMNTKPFERVMDQPKPEEGAEAEPEVEDAPAEDEDAPAEEGSDEA